MLWGMPIWAWVVFFVSRIFWIAAGSWLWVHFFDKVLWSDEIEKEYFGASIRDIRDKQTEGS